MGTKFNARVKVYGEEGSWITTIPIALKGGKVSPTWYEQAKSPRLKTTHVELANKIKKLGINVSIETVEGFKE
jgi:hypothetical protein